MSRIFPEKPSEPGDPSLLPDDGGFTLLEVLVAFGIFSLILGLLFVSIRQTETTVKTLERDNRLIQKMELVQYRVREELLSAYLNQNDPLTEFLGFPSQVNGREADSLIFTTLAQTRMTQSSPVSHLEGVQYILFRRGGSRLFVFMHEQNTNLLSYGTQAVLPEKMLSRVWSMKIRYFDGTQWTDRWNSLQTHTLPLLVKVDLVVEEKNGKKKPFEEEVQLPSSTLLQILGGSGGNQIPGESGSTGN